MNAFELNKIIGWVLAALLVILGGRTFFMIYNEGHGDDHANVAAYKIDVGEDKVADKSKDAKKAAVFDIKPLLVAANPGAGKKVARKCKACHSFEKGGKNKVGPALYGIVNRKIGSAGGFSYSKAMKSKGGKWDYDALAAFLKKPKDYISGNKMAFSGVRGEDKLANLIAYLRSLSDQPAALPK